MSSHNEFESTYIYGSLKQIALTKPSDVSGSTVDASANVLFESDLIFKSDIIFQDPSGNNHPLIENGALTTNVLDLDIIGSKTDISGDQLFLWCNNTNSNIAIGNQSHATIYIGSNDSTTRLAGTRLNCYAPFYSYGIADFNSGLSARDTSILDNLTVNYDSRFIGNCDFSGATITGFSGNVESYPTDISCTTVDAHSYLKTNTISPSSGSALALNASVDISGTYLKIGAVNVGTSLSTLDTSMSAVNSSITSLNSSVSSLNTSVGTLNTDVSALETQTTNFANVIDILGHVATNSVYQITPNSNAYLYASPPTSGTPEIHIGTTNTTTVLDSGTTLANTISMPGVSNSMSISNTGFTTNSCNNTISGGSLALTNSAYLQTQSIQQTAVNSNTYLFTNAPSSGFPEIHIGQYAGYTYLDSGLSVVTNNLNVGQALTVAGATTMQGQMTLNHGFKNGGDYNSNQNGLFTTFCRTVNTTTITTLPFTWPCANAFCISINMTGSTYTQYRYYVGRIVSGALTVTTVTSNGPWPSNPTLYLTGGADEINMDVYVSVNSTVFGYVQTF
jgi:hypothetical protein